MMTTHARLQSLIDTWLHEAAVARANQRADDYAARCQDTAEALRELESTIALLAESRMQTLAKGRELEIAEARLQSLKGQFQRLDAAVEAHNSEREKQCKDRERTDRCDPYKARGRNCPDCPCDDRIILLDF